MERAILDEEVLKSSGIFQSFPQNFQTNGCITSMPNNYFSFRIDDRISMSILNFEPNNFFLELLSILETNR